MNKTLTAIAVAISLSISAPVSADQSPGVSPGSWTDPTTQLTWSVCPMDTTVERTPDGPTCPGYKPFDIQKPWFAAVDAAKGATYDGTGGWRVPSLAETLTVFKCTYDDWYDSPAYAHLNKGHEQYAAMVPGADGYGCPRGYGRPRFIDALNVQRAWTTTTLQPPLDSGRIAGVAHPTRVVVQAVYRAGDPGPFHEEPGYASETLLVRGGTPSPEWMATVAEAGPMATAVANATAAREQAQNQAVGDYQAARQRSEDRQADQRQAYDQRSAAVRAVVRAGDRVAGGLVVRVKGNLVQVQTDPRQDCRYSPDTGQICRPVPSQLVWVERSALRAPR